MFLEKFCDNCGGRLTKGDEVCPHCGVKLKIFERRLVVNAGLAMMKFN